MDGQEQFFAGFGFGFGKLGSKFYLPVGVEE
jgi:hypothetical protein